MSRKSKHYTTLSFLAKKSEMGRPMGGDVLRYITGYKKNGRKFFKSCET
jgi:hypothetical protein